MTPWTVGHRAHLSMEFPRQEHWSGLPFPSPGDLPNPGTEPGSPALQADSSPSEPPGKPQWDLFCNNLEGWEWEGGGREIQEEGYICIPMINSC